MARLSRPLFQAVVRREGHTDVTVPVWPLPFTVGRSTQDGYSAQAPGLWEHHLTIQADSDKGFTATVRQGAVATFEGQPFIQRSLRNGDQLRLGALELQFFLMRPERASLRVWESLVWAIFVVVMLSQFGILAALLQESP